MDLLDDVCYLTANSCLILLLLGIDSYVRLADVGVLYGLCVTLLYNLTL